MSTNNKHIDCLLVGPHETSFSKFEKIMRTSGLNSPVYRDLNLKFLRYNNKPHKISELLEDFCNEAKNGSKAESFNLEEIMGNALVYLASYLDKRNFSFDYICSIQTEKEKLIEKLQNNDISTIALITTTYVSSIPVKEIISVIRKHNKTAKIIVGGPFVWYQARYNSEHEFIKILKFIGADFYVNSSQGEKSLTDIINSVKNKLPFKNINNIYYKTDQEYVKTSEEEEDNKLEENLVNWELFPNYRQGMGFVRTSMSCIFNCAFCDFPLRLGEYKTIDVSYVEQELNSMKKAGNIRFFRFIDDTFNIPLKRFKEILRMIIKNEYNFTWSAFFRCQYADEETIQLMAESGCQAVHVGIESGSPQILKNMNKNSTVEQYHKGLELLNKYGIITYATFVIGFPGETQDTINETLSFIEEAKPTFSLLWPWFCSPLTPIWNEKEKYQLTNWGTNWTHSTMNATQAMDSIEDILVNNKVKNSIFLQILPEYVSYFLNNGFSLDQLSRFFIQYNEGVKNKIIDSKNIDLDEEIFQKMRNCLWPDSIN